MVFDNNFKCTTTATGKYCKVKESLSCNSVPVAYIAWKVSKYGLFSGPNTGKYGPAKTHAVLHNYLPLLKACCHTCQYVGSAITFKERFRINKSDINTGKKDVVQLNNF